MPKENVIVSNILRYLNSLECSVAEKVQGTALSSGKADINACCKGHALRIEVKTPDHGNTASKKQEINLRRWEAAGARTLIAYSLEDVKKLIQSIEEESNDR